MRARTVRVVATLLAFWLLPACTRTIDSGAYGPLQIGASKETTLAALERLDIRSIEPAVFPPIRLVNPERAALDTLGTSSGIRIFAEDNPVALRIAFDGDRVSSSWPNFGEYPNLPRYPYSAQALLAQMQVKITRGLTHAAVFDAIASFRTDQKIAVEAFVAAYEKMRDLNLPPWRGEYRDLLLSSDEWRFAGLAEEVWYPARRSDVALHFRDGKLLEIVHQASLF